MFGDEDNIETPVWYFSAADATMMHFIFQTEVHAHLRAIVSVALQEAMAALDCRFSVVLLRPSNTDEEHGGVLGLG